MSEIKFREHKDAVIAALEAAGLLVGDGEKPDGGGWQGTPGQSVFKGYVVVYRIRGGSRSGNLDDPHEDAEFIFQVTCVGSSPTLAESLADEAETLLKGVTVAGRSIYPSPDMNPGTERDDDVQPPLFYCTPRYRLKTTPA